MTLLQENELLCNLIVSAISCTPTKMDLILKRASMMFPRHAERLLHLSTAEKNLLFGILLLDHRCLETPLSADCFYLPSERERHRHHRRALGSALILSQGEEPALQPVCPVSRRRFLLSGGA